MTYIIGNMRQETIIMLALAIILMSGFFATRLTKVLKLPSVSGYILAGILVGPHLLNIIPQKTVDSMNFVSDIALAFIAFGVGKFFKKDVLRETGLSVLVITLCESVLAGIIVTLAMLFVFRLDTDLSLLLGAIATATAPASTVMTINQYKAKGRFVNTLLQVVALDDVVCLLVFSITAAVVSANDMGGITSTNVLIPILYNIVAVGAGVLFAFVLSIFLSPKRSTDNRLIVSVAMLLGLSGFCSVLDVSPLLSCMVFGAVYINKAHDVELYNQLNIFTPPIMLLFFVVSGMNLDVGVLATVGVVGVSYFVIRIIGKYVGAYFGCVITKQDAAIKTYLGAALVPQAGVAIGLAFLSQRLLPENVGSVLMTIILSSSVLYELVGPACSKFALIRSGAISENTEASDVVEVTEVAYVEEGCKI